MVTTIVHGGLQRKRAAAGSGFGRRGEIAAEKRGSPYARGRRERA
jgi:hypothetical protein